jgi:hypothetical protein
MAFSTRRRHGGAQEEQAVNIDESSKKNRADNRKTFIALVFLCITLVSIFGLHLLVSSGAKKDAAGVSAPSAAERDNAPAPQIGQQQLQSTIDSAQAPEVKSLLPPLPIAQTLPWEKEAAEAVLLSEGRPATASVRGNLASPDAITSEKVPSDIPSPAMPESRIALHRHTASIHQFFPVLLPLNLHPAVPHRFSIHHG